MQNFKVSGCNVSVFWGDTCDLQQEKKHQLGEILHPAPQDHLEMAVKC